MKKIKKWKERILSGAAAGLLLAAAFLGPLTGEARAAGSGTAFLEPEEFYERTIMETDPSFGDGSAVTVFLNQTNSEPVWTVHNDDFRMTEWGGRQRLVTDLSRLNNETYTTWTNAAEVTFPDAGYTVEGRHVDVTYHLDRLSFKGRPQLAGEGKEVIQAAFTGDGALFMSSFAFKDLESGGFYAEDTVTMEVTYSDTGDPVENMRALQCFRDLDIVSGSVQGAVEAVRFEKGYSGQTYVMKGTWLDTSDGSWFKATKATDENTDEVRYSTVYSVITGPSCTFSWTGGNCATDITTVSGGSYPPLHPDVPEKTADRETALPGDIVTYQIRMDFPYTDAETAAAAVQVYDDLDPALDADGAKGTVSRKGEDDTGAWTFSVREGRVLFTAADPASVQGEGYLFTIRVPVRDGSLDGHALVVKDGTLYAKIPNAPGCAIRDRNGIIQEQTGDPVTVLTPAASLSLEKTADKSKIGGARPGDTISYAFVIRNTGRVTLQDVALTDALPVKDLKTDWDQSSDPETGEGTLAPGETVTAGAFYVLTQADVDAGRVLNRAEAIGYAPDKTPVRSADEAETSLTGLPSISLTKEADKDKILRASPGDTISYRFVIRNTGSVTLADVTLTDDLEGLSDLSIDWPEASGEGVLQAGETAEGSALYKISQADIDAGNVINEAAVSGKPKEGDPVSDTDRAQTLLTGTVGVRFSKEAQESVLTGPTAGDQAVFLFRAENTGTQTLYDVRIRDDLEGLSDPVCDWPGEAGVLAPGQVMTARAVYTLTQADIDSERTLYNTAVLTGKGPDGSPVESVDDAEIRISEAPAIHLVKTADPVSIDEAAEGDLVTYTLTGTNTGTVTLYDVTLEDDLEGLQDLTLDWEGEEGILLPGQKLTATASYALTQADIDLGQVINTARIRGTSKAGTEVEHDGEVQTILQGRDAMTLVKEADCSVLTDASPGDIIGFSFTAANTGTRTLTGVRIEDGLEGLSDLSFSWPGEAGVLAPGETMTAAASYTLTRADIDRGYLDNAALLHGKDPDGNALTPQEDSVHVDLPPSPRIELVKEADKDRLDPAMPGDVIRYTFTAANSGNVTLIGVSLEDTLEAEGDLKDLSLDWSGASGEGTLACGETLTGTAFYTVTQEDIDRGQVLNRALVRGTSPSGTEVTDTDEALTDLAGKAGLKLTKTADAVLIRDAQVGDTISYTMEAVNSGNLTLTQVTLTDTLEGLEGFETDWSMAQEAGVLAPGQKVLATADYSLTQEDLDRGYLINTALVSAESKDPESSSLTEEDTVRTDLPAGPAISLTKDVDLEEIDDPEPGQTLNYFFTIENIGNVTLQDVALTDELEGITEIVLDKGGDEDPDTLSPGEVWTGTASYDLDLSDIDAGRVLNRALVTGRGPSFADPVTGEETEGEEVKDTDEALTLISGRPAVSMTKKADPASIVDAKPGDTITYTFSVTNTGNVTLTGLSISDSLMGLETPVFDWAGSSDPDSPAGVLLPGESVAARAVYALTAGDINRGRVVNSALAKARTPGGEVVESETSTARTVLKKTPKTAVGRFFKSPKTGDWNLASLWLVLMLLSLVTGGGAWLIRKRRR